jgi:hypothetical protein
MTNDRYFNGYRDGWHVPLEQTLKNKKSWIFYLRRDGGKFDKRELDDFELA